MSAKMGQLPCLDARLAVEQRLPVLLHVGRGATLASHPLRWIWKLPDQAHERLILGFCELYASEGRPSVQPELLILASLLQSLWPSLGSDAFGATQFQSGKPLVC